MRGIRLATESHVFLFFLLLLFFFFVGGGISMSGGVWKLPLSSTSRFNGTFGQNNGMSIILKFYYIYLIILCRICV